MAALQLVLLLSEKFPANVPLVLVMASYVTLRAVAVFCCSTLKPLPALTAPPYEFGKPAATKINSFAVAVVTLEVAGVVLNPCADAVLSTARKPAYS